MRPTWGHASQGRQAYREGVPESCNPYREGSLGALEWEKGYLKAAAEADNPVACARLEATVSAAKRKAHSIKRLLPTADVVSDVIGVPLRDWPGNCFGIASRLLESSLLDRVSAEHGGLILSYGQYTGPIGKGNLFSHRSFSHHAWLESPEGYVIDATKFVFTNGPAALWAGPTDDYDLSGARLRETAMPHPPEEDGITVSVAETSDDFVAALDRLLGSGSQTSETGRVSHNRLRWVANLPLERLGTDAAAIYDALAVLGMAGFIPIDNRRWVTDAAELERQVPAQKP